MLARFVAMLMAVSAVGAGRVDGAEPAAAPSTAPATRPSAVVKRERDLALFQRWMVDAYDRVGRRDPKWDGNAREMLAAMARIWAWEFSPDGDEYDEIRARFERVLRAGCDDPLVLFAIARRHAFFGRTFDDTLAMHVRAAEGMRASAYHPLLRCMALLRGASYQARSKQDPETSRAKAAEMMEAALALLPAILADAEVPRLWVWQLFETIGDVSRDVAGDREPYAARAFKVLDETSTDRSMVLAVMADFHTSHAWDARGGGFADRVADEKFAKMAERLEVAALAGEEAWKLDHTNPFAAYAMIRVELGQGQGNARMETWFRRAMKADPDSYEACSRKLYYLEPKWHGSVNEMIAFGRECRATNNHDAGLPLILVQAHLAASRYGEDDYFREPQQAYFKNPRVWADVTSVYEPFLQRYPDSLYARTQYMRLAVWAEQWDVARAQLEAMGGRFSWSLLRTRERYTALRNAIEAHAPSTRPATAPDERG